jgi:CRP/FNR family cyclic AMP-dependent transcriptional regulator
MMRHSFATFSSGGAFAIPSARLESAGMGSRSSRRTPMVTHRAPQKASIDKFEILRAHPIFGKLGPQVIERLTSYAHIKTVAAGATVFQRGDAGDCLFAVCAGTIRISNRSTDGRDAVFNLINAGGIFGEIALLDGRERTADAQAVTDCDLMVINRRDFIPLVSGEPELALKLIEVLCDRIRHTSEQVEDIMFLALPARLAKTLLWLATNSKLVDSRRISITQREIGQIIGMTRESTNKQLRVWEERNWIKLERGSIVVLKPDSLAAVAAADPDDKG